MEIEEFLVSVPRLHSWDGGKTWNSGGFGPADLRELYQLATAAGNLPTILETGAGNSTLAFLLAKPKRLISIAPDLSLFQRITTFCDDHGIDCRGLEAVVGRSEPILPLYLNEGGLSLDLGLIDGGHGWPTVFVDFCYVNALLRKGGILILDDVQLYSVGELACFLAKQERQYTFVKKLYKTAVFRKITDERFFGDFGAQPYIIGNQSNFMPIPTAPKNKAAAGKPPALHGLAARMQIRDSAALSAGVALFKGCRVTNPDGTGFGGGLIKVEVVHPRPGDRLLLLPHPRIGVASARVSFDRTIIGTLIDKPPHSTIEIRLGATVYYDAVGAVLQAIGFAAPPANLPARRSVRLSVVDADGDMASVEVTVELPAGSPPASGPSAL